ncbi:WD repeat-containing protein [Reticulomyxa filosa]|uniref:WD repeat-containing protein n=1 Tax=Reticulomyxa filosa TaxID=46433 RepID=X6NH73_RETFI|nr:WD repeat-containing protein [Reticulomyxa filosa]|eukprot:ETO25084.1 WD repeat-containing protein [Reticulomyxa filosa]
MITKIQYKNFLKDKLNKFKLPTLLDRAQCVLHKHELLICGGFYQKACYSYHTIKNEYKFICEYPSDIILDGHCVVKLVDNNNKDKNQITLLSFGSSSFVKKKTYIDDEIYISNKSNEFNNYNKWIPFIDNHNHPIIIGRDNDDYTGMRALIGGSNNHLLFITYWKNNISVFDLHKFRFIKHCTLPANNEIWYHCFISNSEHGQGQEMMKINKQNYQMLLFCGKTGLSIEYNENNNTFQFRQLSVCKDIATLISYAYVYINGVILFFGGWDVNDSVVSKSVYKYSIRKKKWNNLKIYCLLDYNSYIYIIGGHNTSTNMKIRLSELIDHMQTKNEIKFIIQHWIRILKIRLGWIDDFNKIITKYVRGFESLMILRGHDNTVNSVQFSADSCKIVSASYDCTVRIWDVVSGKQLQIFIGHTDRVFSARFSPDGNTIVSCSGDKTIRLWNINTGNEVMKLRNDSNKILDVEFSPDGRYIVSDLKDNTIQLWDLYSGMEITKLLGHSRDVVSTRFSSNGKMIVSSNDKIINLWDVESGERLKQFKGHSSRVMRAKFSPDDKFIISCSLDATIRIWNIETGIEWNILKEHSHHVNDIKYFPDGQTIVSCSSDNTIRLWNVELVKRIQILEGHSQAVRCVDITRNGNTIASGSTDCTIRIWK